MLKKFGHYFFSNNFKSITKLNRKKFGIIDRMLEKRQKKQMDEELNFFLDRQSFKFTDYKQYVQRQIDQQQKGVLKKLFSNTDEENVEELLEDKRLLSVLVEDELERPWSVCNSPKLQKEIALVCQVPYERVQKLVENFKQIYQIHYWLRHRKKFNKKIPKNSDEFQVLMKYEQKVPYFLKQEQKRKIEELAELRQKSQKRKDHYERIEEAKAKRRQNFVWVKKKLNYK